MSQNIKELILKLLNEEVATAPKLNPPVQNKGMNIATAGLNLPEDLKRNIDNEIIPRIINLPQLIMNGVTLKNGKKFKIVDSSDNIYNYILQSVVSSLPTNSGYKSNIIEAIQILLMHFEPKIKSRARNFLKGADDREGVVNDIWSDVFDNIAIKKIDKVVDSYLSNPESVLFSGYIATAIFRQLSNVGKKNSERAKKVTKLGGTDGTLASLENPNSSSNNSLDPIKVSMKFGEDMKKVFEILKTNGVFKDEYEEQMFDAIILKHLGNAGIFHNISSENTSFPAVRDKFLKNSLQTPATISKWTRRLFWSDRTQRIKTVKGDEEDRREKVSTGGSITKISAAIKAALISIDPDYKNVEPATWTASLFAKNNEEIIKSMIDKGELDPEHLPAKVSARGNYNTQVRTLDDVINKRRKTAQSNSPKPGEEINYNNDEDSNVTSNSKYNSYQDPDDFWKDIESHTPAYRKLTESIIMAKAKRIIAENVARRLNIL